jgi:NADPH-dependent glutamate synthase beta subunit-like oxidoreductase
VTSLHSNNNFIISVLSVLAACGISMEKNTKVGKAISVRELKNRDDVYLLKVQCCCNAKQWFKHIIS